MIAILAAGESRRFGSPKFDALLAGRRVGCWAVEAALATRQQVIVVTQPGPKPMFLDELRGMVVHVINPDYREGPNRSLRCAVDFAVELGVRSLLIHLADMPFVLPDTLVRIASATTERGISAARHADGSPGVPACFGAVWFDALRSLAPGEGAKSLLRSAKPALIDLTKTERFDIDTIQDLDEAERVASTVFSR